MRGLGAKRAAALASILVLASLSACERQRTRESSAPSAEQEPTQGALIRVPTPVDLRGIESLSDLAYAAEATLWGKGRRTTTLCLRSARCNPQLAGRVAKLDLIADLGFTAVECHNHRESFAVDVGGVEEATPSIGWSRLLKIEITGDVIAMRDVNCSAERLTSFVSMNQPVLSDQGFAAVRCGDYHVDLPR